MVAGPFVKRPGRCDALVHAVDLFPTVAEMSGASLEDGASVDGLSFLPLLSDPKAPAPRETVYTEQFLALPSGGYHMDRRALRDARYKLVRLGAKEHLYDLHRRDPEREDLLAAPLSPEAQAARERLAAALDRLDRELVQ